MYRALHTAIGHCYILDHMFRQYFCSHGLISYESGLTVMNESDFDNYVFPEPHNVTVQCNPAISQANRIVGEYVIVDVCCPSIVQQELRLQKMVSYILLFYLVSVFLFHLSLSGNSTFHRHNEFFV